MVIRLRNIFDNTNNLSTFHSYSFLPPLFSLHVCNFPHHLFHHPLPPSLTPSPFQFCWCPQAGYLQPTEQHSPFALIARHPSSALLLILHLWRAGCHTYERHATSWCKRTSMSFKQNEYASANICTTEMGISKVCMQTNKTKRMPGFLHLPRNTLACSVSSHNQILSAITEPYMNQQNLGWPPPLAFSFSLWTWLCVLLSGEYCCVLPLPFLQLNTKSLLPIGQTGQPMRCVSTNHNDESDSTFAHTGRFTVSLHS